MFNSKILKSKIKKLKFYALASSILMACSLWNACGGAHQNSAPVYGASCGQAAPALPFTSASSSGSNSMNVSVGGTSLCGSDFNLICTSVTICAPGNTSACQVISNILVDTGSYGLRVFAQAIPGNLCTALPAVTDGSGNTIGECAQFGSSNQWGSVATAGVQLAGLPLKTMPIEIVNSSFGLIPGGSACGGGDVEISPQFSGINGILGVGLMQYDCDSNCVGSGNADNGIYFSCNGSSCNPSALPLANQVQNPVSLQSSPYNNGVSVTLPAVPAGTATTQITGTLIFGVGGTSGNNPTATIYGAQNIGNFAAFKSCIGTGCNTNQYSQSFIDSGSNAYYFFNPGSLTACPTNSSLDGLWCSAGSFNASYKGVAGQTSTGTLAVSIINATVYSPGSTTNVYNSIGGDISGTGLSAFDWGLPFFFGKTITTCINGQSCTVSTGTDTGPYWAF